MKQDQKFTPKYWIAHDKTTDDVLIKTAGKSLDECKLLTYQHLGYGWLSWKSAGTEPDRGAMIDAQIRMEDEYPNIEFKIFEVKLSEHKIE